MKNVLITSEYFGKFSSEAREVLVDAGFNVIDNPYGHQFLTPEQIIPFIKYTADVLTKNMTEAQKDMED